MITCGECPTDLLGDTLQEQGRHMQGQQLGYNLQRDLQMGMGTKKHGKHVEKKTYENN